MRSSLILDFANTKRLDPRITYTNASANRSYFDAAGALKYAGVNEPIFDHAPSTGRSLGLGSWEARTNLLLNSTTDGANLATQSITTTAAAARTLSFYGTGTVTLSGTHSATVVGTGAFPVRTTYTYTPSAGTLTLTVTGTVQYANDELGAFASAYIPTAGASVTRSADVISMSGTNFSDWYNPAEGTITCDASISTLAVSSGLWAIGNGTDVFGFRNSIYSSSAVTNGQWLMSQALSGVGQISTAIPSGSFAPNVPKKTVFGYKANDTVGASNGVIGVTDTTNSIPTGTFFLSIGSLSAGWSGATSYLNGYIHSITYSPRRSPNSTIQALST